MMIKILILTLFINLSYALYGEELSTADKMKQDFLLAMNRSPMHEIYEEQESENGRNWEQLLRMTFDEKLNYKSCSHAYIKLKQSKIKVAVIFFQKYSKNLAPVNSFKFIEMRGVLVNKAEVFYTLLIGRNRAVMILSDFKEPDVTSMDVINLFEKAREISTSEITPSKN